MCQSLICSFYIILICQCSLATSATETEEYRLHRDLFASYNRHLRPVLHHHQQLQVTFDLALYSIIQLSTREQILSTNAEMIVRWNDSYLSWDPEQYNGTKVVHIPSENLWYPDIVLYNTADSSYQHSTLATNAIVKHTGEVELVSHVMFHSSCDVDVTWYPFDQQECKMQFASWSYDVTKILIQSNSAYLSEYQPNPEFFLENFYSKNLQTHDPCCEKPFSTVIYHLQLQRRPSHPVFFFIFPGSVVNICAIFAFLLPTNSGEKISLAMSSLVAMMVFLMTVTMNIPPSSVIPLIGRYYFSCIVVLGVNVMLCVISEKCRHEVHTISRKLRVLSRILGRLCFLTPPDTTVVSPSTDASQDIVEKTSVTLQEVSDHVKTATVNLPEESANWYELRSLQTLEQIRALIQRHLNQDQSNKLKTPDCIYFCRVLDRIFFILLVLATLIFNLEFLFASPHSRSFQYCPQGLGACPADFDYDRYEEMIESGRGVSNF